MILKIKKRKKEAVRGGVVFLMAACICLGQAAPVLALDAAWSQKVEITAHRGDSIKALENTIPAFEKAIESGADWIELDVKETRDNVPVVFHDSSLKRLMGQDGTIREMTLEEIKKLHPAASMGPGYNNVKIPTLEETLDTCKGRIKLNIEIKEDGTESSDFTERVIQLIRDKGMTVYDHIVLLYCFGKGKSRRTIPQDWIYPVKGYRRFQPISGCRSVYAQY